MNKDGDTSGAHKSNGRPVKIGVDARTLNDRYHGIGRVAFELAVEMQKLENIDLVLVLGKTRSNRFDLQALLSKNNVRHICCDLDPVDVRQNWKWRGLFEQMKVDVAFFPYHLGAPLWGPVPRLVLVHDCIFEMNPAFAPSRQMRRLYMAMTAAVVRRSTVATISRASARELACRYGVRVPDRLVIPNGVEHGFNESPASFTVLHHQLGVRRPYLLHVGARRPHKNVGLLIEVVQKMPGHHLVLVGTVDERFRDPVGELITRFGLSGRVHHIPFVPERLMSALYAHADAFLYPSLAEGFGLPLLESMAAGTPVVASNIAVFREIAGDAALFVPAHDVDGWTAACERVVSDRALRQRLADEGKRAVRRYTWSSAAERIVRGALDIFQKAPRG